jgi:Lsr2
MATQAKVIWYDDMTGDEFAEGDGSTVQFSLDGNGYEIDLSTDSQGKMFDVLGFWIEYARAQRARKPLYRRPASARRESQNIRAWAIEQGLLAEHQHNGRMPDYVKTRYAETH